MIVAADGPFTVVVKMVLGFLPFVLLMAGVAAGFVIVCYVAWCIYCARLRAKDRRPWVAEARPAPPEGEAS